MALVTVYNNSTTGNRIDNLEPPQAWYGASTTVQLVHESSRQVDRSYTPNYRALREKRQRVKPLPYTSRSVKREHPVGWIKTQTTGQPYAQIVTGALNENLMNNLRARGHQFSNWNEVDGLTEAVYQLALQGCRLKFKDQSAELGAGLIQLGQTKSLFVDTTIGLGRLVAAIRAKNIKSCREAITDLIDKSSENRKLSSKLSTKRRRRILQENRAAMRKAERKVMSKGVDASGAFLAYSFGWVPTMMDLDASLHQLAKYSVQSDYRVTHRKRVSHESSIDYQIGEQNSAYGSGTSFQQVQAQVIISALPTYHSLILGQGLGLMNPPAFAWEVIPASFLVDYVVDIGGWLNSFDALLGYDGCETVVTRKMLIRQTGKSDPPSVRTFNGVTSTFSASYSLSCVFKHMRRDVSEGQPPFVARPNFGAGLNSWGRIGTTSALSVQALSYLQRTLNKKGSKTANSTFVAKMDKIFARP